ncbi:DNA-3-methyladenine glycosylase [bacterium]|nr:DNA-3-methyladenine glycosylase [bacterium]
MYKSYGIHHCLNIVTDKENFASGVLIRAVFISKKNERLASGPGLVTKTFGIDTSFNSLEVLNNNFLWISKRDSTFEEKDLIQTTRIGISKAKNIKWRWYLKNSKSIWEDVFKRLYISRSKASSLESKFADCARRSRIRIS